MLKGLQINEESIEVVSQGDFRLESDFYTIESFFSTESYTGNDVLESSNYNSIYGMNSEGKGYLAIRMNEFDNLFTGTPSQYAHNFNELDFEFYKLRKNDILICRTNGNPDLVGKSALVAMDYPFVYESHLFKVRPNQDLITSATLTVFLNCKYGKAELKKYSMQGNQSNFSLAKFKEIKIPKFDKNFNFYIEKLVYQSFDKLNQSKNIYQKAEDLLLEELGLRDFQPSEQGVNIKSLKDSFLSTGRLDAEYYQPKYDEIEAKFDSFPRMTLAEIVKYPISSGITPKAGGSDYTDQDNGSAFIRAVNLQNGQVLDNDLNFVKPYIHDVILKRTKLKRDDILFSIAGTVGRTAIFQHEFEANINQAVAILRFDETQVKRIFLVCFFNSEIGKLFVSKYSRQGLQTNLNLQEVGELSIPILPEDKQIAISDLIQQSFTLKTKSEQLLENAKTLVEMTIEQGEEKAIVWYQNQGKSIE